MLEKLQLLAEDSVLEAHPHYRTVIGALGVTLPFILIVGWWLLVSKVESSISAYYYTRMQDWLVGTLCVIGVFLICYRYRPLKTGRPRSNRKPVQTGAADAWLGKVAGSCAVAVALIPTNAPPEAKDVPPTIGTLHGLAAGILFLCLALFPLLLFSQGRRKDAYRRYGWTMIALLLLTVVYAFAPKTLRESAAVFRPLLLLETLLIVVFGMSWFKKGRELAAASKQDQSPEQARSMLAGSAV